MKKPVLTCAKKNGTASKKQKDLTVDGNHDNKAKLLCDLCGNGYKTQVSLNRQKETHSNALQYECEHCRQGFKSSQCLRHHQGDAKKLLSDGLVDKNKLSCPKCHENFVCKGLLKNHQKCHSPIKKELSKKKSTSKSIGKKQSKEVDGQRNSGTGTTKLRTQHKVGGTGTSKLMIQQKDGDTDATQLRTQQKDGGADATDMGSQQEDGGTGTTKLRTQQKDGDSCTRQLKTKQKDGGSGATKLRTQQNGCKASLLCEVCGKGFSSVKRLQWHRKTHQDTTIKTKQHKCDPCNKVFRTPSCLKQHNISHHGAKSSFQCKTCKRHFLNNSRLAEHVRVVHTGEKIFHCPRCKKGFTCSRYLKRHVLEPSCTPQEKYKCHECNKLCKSKYSLMYHVNTYHGNRPFRCKYCDRRYATEEYWQKHEAAHNGVYGAIPKRKVKKATLDYMCEQCGKAYGNKHLLARHQLLHTGEKPHICTTCSKSFRCKSTLIEHVRIHSGEKPFYCEYCQTRFRLSGHLRYHLKAVHKVKKVGPIKKIKPGEEVPNRDGVEGTQDGKGGSGKTTAKVFFSPLASLKSIKASVRRRDEYRPVVESGMRCNKMDNVQPLMLPGDVGIQPDGGRADELLNMLIQGSWLHGNSEGQDERTKEDAFRDQFHQTQLYTSQYLPPMQNVAFDGRFSDRPYIYQDPGVDRSNPFGNVSFSQQFPGHSLQQMLFEPQQGKMNLYPCGSQKKTGYDSQSLQPIAYNAPLQGQGLNFGMTSQRQEQNLFPAGLMSDLPVTSGEKGLQDHQGRYETSQGQDQVGYPSELITQMTLISGDKAFEQQHYHEGQIGFNMMQQHDLASFSSRLASSQDKHLNCHDQNVAYDETQKNGQTVLASASVVCPDVGDKHQNQTSYHPSCDASELPSTFNSKSHLGSVVGYETQNGPEQVQQMQGTGYEKDKRQTSYQLLGGTSELPSTFNTKTHLGSVVGYGIQKGLDQMSFFNALTSELPLTSGNKDDDNYVPQYKELQTRTSTIHQPNEKLLCDVPADSSSPPNQSIGDNLCKANVSTVEDDVCRSNVKVHEDNLRSSTTQGSIDSTETLPSEVIVQKSSPYHGGHPGPNSTKDFSTRYSLHHNTGNISNFATNALTSENSNEYQNLQKDAASELVPTQEGGILPSTCNVSYSAPCTNRKISDLIQYLQDSNKFDQKSDKTINEEMISVHDEVSKDTAATSIKVCNTSSDAISIHEASQNTSNYNSMLDEANNTTELCNRSCDAISIQEVPKNTDDSTMLAERNSTIELCNTSCDVVGVYEASKNNAKLTTLEEAKLTMLEKANSTTELCKTSSDAISVYETSKNNAKLTTLEEANSTTELCNTACDVVSVYEASKNNAKLTTLGEAKLTMLEKANSTIELCNTSSDAISVYETSKNNAKLTTLEEGNSTTELCNTACDVVGVYEASKNNAKLTTLEEAKLTTLDAKLTTLEEAKLTTLEEAKLTTLEEVKLTTLEEAKLTTLEEANSTTDLCDTSSHAICKLNGKRVVDSETLDQLALNKQLKEINAKTECAADPELKTGEDVGDGKMEEGKEEELKHLCDVCGKSYQNKSSLRHHKKTHVKEGYQCAVCQQTFNRRNTMRLHTINQHGGKSPHSCTRCEKGFLHVARLEEHIRIQHTGEAPFSCSKCSKTFTSRRNLRRHLNEPTCAPKQKYPCDQCSKSCKSQYSLTYHKSLHHTKKPFQCELCGKGYATKENCKRHEDNHGEIPKWKKMPKPTSKDFVCDICNKSYSNKHFLARHKQTHSGVKPFKCNICAKAFLYNSALKEHLRTHSGEKPYICQHCGVAFRLSGHLRYHLKAVHDGDKQYSCEVCNKCFVFESTMLHHMKTHEGNKKERPTKKAAKKNQATHAKNSNNQIQHARSSCNDKALKECTIKEIHEDSIQENLASDLRVAVKGNADDSAVLGSSATAGVTSTAMATSTAGTSSTAPSAALQTLTNVAPSMQYSKSKCSQQTSDMASGSMISMLPPPVSFPPTSHTQSSSLLAALAAHAGNLLSHSSFPQPTGGYTSQAGLVSHTPLLPTTISAMSGTPVPMVTSLSNSSPPSHMSLGPVGAVTHQSVAGYTIGS